MEQNIYVPAAQEGLIVVLNTTKLRSDAILLTNEKQVLLSLSFPMMYSVCILKNAGYG